MRKLGQLHDFATNKQLLSLKVAIVNDLRVLRERLDHIETFLSQATEHVPDDVSPKDAGFGSDASPVEPAGNDGFAVAATISPTDLHNPDGLRPVS